MVQRRHISYGTQTTEETKAWDTFMSLVATTRKLGISFFEYVRDRIGETELQFTPDVINCKIHTNVSPLALALNLQ